MDLHMPLDTCRLHWNIAWRDDDESRRYSKLAKHMGPPALLPTVQPSGEGKALRTGLYAPGPPLCAHVEAHNLGGWGKPTKLRRPLHGSKGRRWAGTGGTICGQVAFRR